MVKKVGGKRFMVGREGLKEEKGLVHLYVSVHCTKINHFVGSYRAAAVVAAAALAVVA